MRDAPPLIDWARTGRRLRAVAAALAVAVLVVWLITWAVTGTPRPALLAELAGFGLLAMFVCEFFIVGGTAVRAMLTAGARGDRLASDDVSLLPPQVRRRKHANNQKDSGVHGS